MSDTRTLWLRSGLRVIGVAVAAVAVALLLASSSFAGVFVIGTHRVLDDALEQQLKLCLRGEGVATDREGTVDIEVYDIAHVRAGRMHATGLNPELLVELQQSEGRIAGFSPRLLPQVVRQMAESGPCSLMRARVRRPADVQLQTRLRALGLFCGVLALTAVTMGFIVVNPLLRRITRIRRAAATIGQAPSFESAGDAHPDLLGALSRDIDRAHGDIVGAHEQLAARGRILEEQLQALAHDVRTPLASLQLQVEQALQVLESRPDSPRAQLAAALDDVYYISALAENLVLEARLRDSHSQLATEFELGEIVERVGRRFAALGRRGGVELAFARPDHPVFVVGDPVRTEQAVANLVHNALAHGKRRGNVALLLSCRPQSRDRASLRVSDDGPGFTKEVLAQFEGAPEVGVARARSERGLGLGLRMAREICRRSGWTLSLVNGPEGGATAEIVGISCRAEPPG